MAAVMQLITLGILAAVAAAESQKSGSGVSEQIRAAGLMELAAERIADHPCVSRKPFSQGALGTGVRSLQFLLRMDQSAVNSQFDQATVDKLKEWQTSAGVTASGAVDDETLGKLCDTVKVRPGGNGQTGFVDTKFFSQTMLKKLDNDFFLCTHGADGESGNAGMGMLYYSFVHSLKAKKAVVLGSGFGFVPMMVRQAQLDLGLQGSHTVLVDLESGDTGGQTAESRQDWNNYRTNDMDIFMMQEDSVGASRWFGDASAAPASAPAPAPAAANAPAPATAPAFVNVGGPVDAADSRAAAAAAADALIKLHPNSPAAAMSKLERDLNVWYIHEHRQSAARHFGTEHDMERKDDDAELKGAIDYLHIDACHETQCAIDDFETYLPLMSKSRFIITMHDTTCLPSVKTAWDQLQAKYGKEYQFANFAWIGCGIGMVTNSQPNKADENPNCHNGQKF